MVPSELPALPQLPPHRRALSRFQRLSLITRIGVLGAAIILTCALCGTCMAIVSASGSGGSGSSGEAASVSPSHATAAGAQHATATATATHAPLPTAPPSPTSTSTPSPAPTATPPPRPPTATPRPPTVQPIPPAPTATPGCVNPYCNPWGYNFTPGNPIYSPPSGFCGYFPCIPSFWSSTNGYVEECHDGDFSHSGGRSGACSYHGGELRPLYSH